MRNRKTHFEQVPLEVVKKVVLDGKEMTNGQLKYPKWQAPLQEVILEFDREALRKKLEKVETSILERLQELHREAKGHSERRAIKDALSTVRVIQRDRLGFPDWK
jgi:hypothetical protein